MEGLAQRVQMAVMERMPFLSMPPVVHHCNDSILFRLPAVGLAAEGPKVA